MIWSLEKKQRLRTRTQRVKHARKFYQRQRTSSTKLSIDLHDKLTKLKESSHHTSQEKTISPAAILSPNEPTVPCHAEINTIMNATISATNNKNANLKLYKPSFKVEKLLNDSRGMKKYLIDYDCLMKSSKQKAVVPKTFSLNNLSSILLNTADSVSDREIANTGDNCLDDVSSYSSIQLNKLLDWSEQDNSFFEQIRSSFQKISQQTDKSSAEITVESLNDCMMKKKKKIKKTIVEEDEEIVQNDRNDHDDYEDEEEEKKSFSSFSNKCSSGYLSDF